METRLIVEPTTDPLRANLVLGIKDGDKAWQYMRGIEVTGVAYPVADIEALIAYALSDMLYNDGKNGRSYSPRSVT